jgi:hypothetical protein
MLSTGPTVTSPTAAVKAATPPLSDVISFVYFFYVFFSNFMSLPACAWDDKKKIYKQGGAPALDCQETIFGILIFFFFDFFCLLNFPFGCNQISSFEG